MRGLLGKDSPEAAEASTQHVPLCASAGEAGADEDPDFWHYCMVFPCVLEKSSVARPLKVLESIFMEDVLLAWEEQPDAGELWTEFRAPYMDRGVFIKAVWDKILEIVCGQSCTFDAGTDISIDGDEVFLLLRLPSDKMDALAHTAETWKQLSLEAYAFKGRTCPVLARTLGQKLGFNPKPPAKAPAYMRFDHPRKDAFRRYRDQVINDTEVSLEGLMNDFSAERVRHMAHCDTHAVAFAALVEKLALAAGTPAEAKLRGIFDHACAMHEEKFFAAAREVRGKSAEEAFEARLKRWSAPTISTMDDFRTAELHDGFNDLDFLRVMFDRMSLQFDVEAMETLGIISAFFPLHRKATVDHLNMSWSNFSLCSILQWPGEMHTDDVRGYFGEEVAFFFTWMNFVIRSLIIPATVPVACTIAESVSSHDIFDTHIMFGLNLRSVLYGCVVAWLTCLSANFAQFSHTKDLIWGMKAVHPKGVRLPSFDPSRRGSWGVSSIRTLHWVVLLAFVVETIYTSWFFSSLSAKLHRAARNSDADKFYYQFGPFEVDGAHATIAAKYGITVNIKVMTFLWGVVSPAIASCENWSNDLRAKDAKVRKDFVLTSVIVYYPFFYLAFFQQVLEGGPSSNSMEQLSGNVSLWFVLHVVSVAVTLVAQLLMQRYSKWSEQQKCRQMNLDAVYAPYEEQAKMGRYAGDDDDYMELSISLGFIAMFSAIVPFACFVAFVSLLVEIRLLAWRMMHVLRRPVPKAQVGIGVWQAIIQCLFMVSGVTSVALFIFALEPLKSRLSAKDKILAFTISEHLCLAVLTMLYVMVPERSASDAEIMESHDQDQFIMRNVGQTKRSRVSVGTVNFMEHGDVNPGFPPPQPVHEPESRGSTSGTRARSLTKARVSR